MVLHEVFTRKATDMVELRTDKRSSHTARLNASAAQLSNHSVKSV